MIIEESLKLECIKCHAVTKITAEDIDNNKQGYCVHCGAKVSPMVWDRARMAFSAFRELNKAQYRHNEDQGGTGFFFSYDPPGFDTLERFLTLTGAERN